MKNMLVITAGTQRRSEQGNATLAAILAIVLGAMVVSLVNDMHLSHMQGLHSVAKSAKLRDLRHWVRNRVDCANTVANMTSCQPQMPLYDSDEQVVVASGTPVTVVGGYQLRAGCFANEIKVEVLDLGAPPATAPWAPLFSGSMPLGCHFVP